MGEYVELSKKILSYIGGKNNVERFTHCVTRMRFVLKNPDLVEKEKIDNLDGVLGSQFNAGQYQIIIGQQIADVVEDFSKVSGISLDAVVDENLDENLNENIVKDKSIKGYFNRILNTISACIFPVIPIFMGAGLILLIGNIIGPSMLNLVGEESDIYILFNYVGRAGLYFMPIFIAWSAARHFNTSIPIAMFLGAFLLFPDLLNLINEGGTLKIYGIPMPMIDYSNQILPSILTVWILSYVYGFIDKKMPNSLKYAFSPLITILIMLPLELCLLSPIGTYIGKGIAAFSVWIASFMGPLAIGLIGGLWYLLVGLGMDKALVPFIINNLTLQGYDNLFWLSAMSATYALMGVALAYVIKSKKMERSAAMSSFITLAIGGVSEPTIFGCLFRYKKTIISYFIGGFVGGILSGLFNLKAYTLGTGNLLFFTICAKEGGSLLPAIITSLIAFIVSFLLALFIGFKDKEHN